MPLRMRSAQRAQLFATDQTLAVELIGASTHRLPDALAG